MGGSMRRQGIFAPLVPPVRAEDARRVGVVLDGAISVPEVASITAPGVTGAHLILGAGDDRGVR
jgi:hypothetical protein